MKKVIQCIAVICLSIITISSARSEGNSNKTLHDMTALEYDIYLGNKHIGQFWVEKIVHGSTIKYIANSTAEAHFFGKHYIEYSLISVFEDELMVRTELRTCRNKKPNDTVLIQWTGNCYEVYKNGQYSKIYKPIYFTTIQLYFQIPGNNLDVFSECDLRFKAFNLMGERNYVLADFGKNKGTDYSYNSMYLTNIKIDYFISDFSVVKKQ